MHPERSFNPFKEKEAIIPPIKHGKEDVSLAEILSSEKTTKPWINNLKEDPTFLQIFLQEQLKVQKNYSPDFTLRYSEDMDEAGWLEPSKRDYGFNTFSGHVTHGDINLERRGNWNALQECTRLHPEIIAKIAPNYKQILSPDNKKRFTDEQVLQAREQAKYEKHTAGREWLYKHAEEHFKDIQKDIEAGMLTLLKRRQDPYFTQHFNGSMDEHGNLFDEHHRTTTWHITEAFHRLCEKQEQAQLQEFIVKTLLKTHPEIEKEYPEATALFAQKPKPGFVPTEDPSAYAEVESEIRKGRPGHQEIENEFAKEGLELNQKLRWLLREDPRARTSRYGSGFLQATYFVGKCIQEHDDQSLTLFEASPLEQSEEQESDTAEPTIEYHLESITNKEVFERVIQQTKRPESKILIRIMMDTVFPHEPTEKDTTLPTLPEKLNIGSCTTAEELYSRLITDHEKASVTVDAQGKPLFIEKPNGEKNLLALKEIVINGVRIPPGGLFAGKLRNPELAKKSIKTIEDYEGFEFLRLTIYTLPPTERIEAFDLDSSIYGGSKEAKIIRLRDFIDLANDNLSVPSLR